jgi:hypothetical protein
MKSSLGVCVAATLLSIGLVVAVLNLAATGDPTVSFMSPAKLDMNVDGIKDVDVEFVNHTIYLNVYLSKPLSCAQVITGLGITTLPVNNKTFSPSCQKVDSELIRISYIETVST